MFSLNVVISTVLHEQKNRTLDKLKYISVFMKYASFVRLLIYVLAVLNQGEDHKITSQTNSIDTPHNISTE